ncbi:condensation domain-containing protein [Streptomyces lydicus]|nr:condensation domain-containing protein [Streptomyces lydicus]
MPRPCPRSCRRRCAAAWREGPAGRRKGPAADPARGPVAALPLAFAQQQLWFLDQLRPGDSRYNSAVALRLTGPLDRPALSRALDAVVARHESLRTTFDDIDGRPVQQVHPAAPVPLPLRDVGRDRPAAAQGTGPRRGPKRWTRCCWRSTPARSTCAPVRCCGRC